MQPKPLKNLNGQICQICGDTVGITETGVIFVACNECAFLVCRPCYEYERRDGNQSCPQWRMNSIIFNETRVDNNGREMMAIFLHRQDMSLGNINDQIFKSESARYESRQTFTIA